MKNEEMAALKTVVLNTLDSIRDLGVAFQAVGERVAGLASTETALVNAHDTRVATIESGPSLTIADVLHSGRSALMREIPSGAECVVSAGCSSLAYFEWIDKVYGPIKEHIGIELYMPKPDNLPDNVRWVVNTVGNMEGVDSGCADLVISGQNIEHLWQDDVVGFLLESARVLKEGGHLIVDSPNRALTEPLVWSHPEHTVEFTVDEICDLLRLAGFEVTKKAGIWLCQDPNRNRILGFDPTIPDSDWGVLERVAAAKDKPEFSLLWWVEAKRTHRMPNSEALRELMRNIYDKAWPERIQRLQKNANLKREIHSDGEWLIVPEGWTDVVFYGPYMPLRAGKHRCVFEFAPTSDVEQPFARCDIAYGVDGAVLSSRDVGVNENKVELTVELEDLVFGGQFRCFGLGGAGFKVKASVQLTEDV